MILISEPRLIAGLPRFLATAYMAQWSTLVYDPMPCGLQGKGRAARSITIAATTTTAQKDPRVQNCRILPRTDRSVRERYGTKTPVEVAAILWGGLDWSSLTTSRKEAPLASNQVSLVSSHTQQGNIRCVQPAFESAEIVLIIDFAPRARVQLLNLPG